ncbi:carboxypeptidase-like regulatory domain-containing protein [Flavobacterium sp. LC2016-01]|uniref:Kelch repeat-containing protein n=1 Tax=Flavobacterium sp. LC2016-01 TaxID=2675876 RepID=UPI0013228D83|nr:galactose oxidase [Flavobacterium sp. LC2016-01]
MKKLLFTLFLFPLFLFSQNQKGSVFSRNDEPLEDVNILALNSKIGTITNKKGEFSTSSFSSLKADEIVEFSHLGFTTLKISIENLAKLKFHVILSEETENLNELKIEANHELKLKSKLSYTKLKSIKYGISSFGSFLKDGKIYITGGDASIENDPFKRLRSKNQNFDDNDNFIQKFLEELRQDNSIAMYKSNLLIYDIALDSWQITEEKFKKRAFHNVNYYNNTIYILGGKKISMNGKFEYLQNEIEVFDMDKKTVTIDKTYPHQASDAASFSYKDNIIVIGGSIKSEKKDEKDFTNKVHFYNITSGYWYELASMPIAMETNGILIEDKIYLIGGNNGNPVPQIETFDLTSEKWQTEGELFSGLERPAITYNDDTIYFFENKKMYVYNIKTKLLKEYTIELNLYRSAMYYNNNKLYIVGGYTINEYSKTPSSLVFSISTEEFDTTKPNRTKTLSQIELAN